jgi:hypothetical protein
MKIDTAQFLLACKNLHQLSIDPFDVEKKDAAAYIELTHLGIDLIQQNGLQSFLNLLLETHYKASKWAAMIALEYGKPDPNEVLLISGTETIIKMCLDEIRRKPIGLTAEQADNYNAWVSKMEIRYDKRL